MSDQLQDLLKRVYDEGVSKANAEAEKIISAANEQAEKTIAQAKMEAEKIIQDAEKKTNDLKKNTDSDLNMAYNHTLSALKQKITDLVLSEALNAKVSETFNDAEFVKKIILEAITAWKENNASGIITISEKMKPLLDDFYLKSLKDILDGKLQINFSPTMKQGFVIAPEDKTYQIMFDGEDFANLFKNYLRPRTKEILFGK
ncbi:MAG: hypothetical protein ABFC98_02880 [Candidatus Cloacimonas sp.]